MKNIKKVLSAVTALGLTTTVAFSVTSCADNNTLLTLPVGVTSVLGLTDSKGNPKITPDLKLDTTTHKYEWSSNVPNITGKNFVKDDLQAKNDDCSSLLKSTFKLIPDINGKFNSSELDKITAKISYLPSLTKNIDNDDFYISGGSIQIQFVKENLDIGEVYNVNIKSGINNSHLVEQEIANLAILTADFNTTGSSDSNPLFDGKDGFKIDQPIKDLTTKECQLWTPDNIKATVSDKIFDSLNKILGTKINIEIINQSKTTGQWSDKDYIEIQFSFTKGFQTATIAQTTKIFPNPK